MENIGEILCEIFTAEGKQCPRISKTYNVETRKMVCNRHNYICEKKYEDYKSICEKVKNAKSCRKDMTVTELRRMLKFIRQCKLQRMEFVNVCCEKYTDIGHATMIVKLDRMEKTCNRLLDNQ